MKATRGSARLLQSSAVDGTLFIESLMNFGSQFPVSSQERFSDAAGGS